MTLKISILRLVSFLNHSLQVESFSLFLSDGNENKRIASCKFCSYYMLYIILKTGQTILRNSIWKLLYRFNNINPVQSSFKFSKIPSQPQSFRNSDG